MLKPLFQFFFFMFKWSLPSAWPQINCKWIMCLINSISEFLSEFYIHSWAISLFGHLKNFSIWTCSNLNQNLSVSRNFVLSSIYHFLFPLSLFMLWTPHSGLLLSVIKEHFQCLSESILMDKYKSKAIFSPKLLFYHLLC